MIKFYQVSENAQCSEITAQSPLLGFFSGELIKATDSVALLPEILIH